MHRDRPVYISIIAWFYLVAAAFSVLALAMMLYDPALAYVRLSREVPFGFALAQIGLSAIAAAVGAWNLLRGANWARWLMVFLFVESVVWTFFAKNDPAALWVALLWSLIMIVVLFIPPSNEFFRSRRGRRRTHTDRPRI